MPSYYAGPELSLEQVAQVAYQAGFRGDLLVQMTALPSRESKVDEDGLRVSSGAHRTNQPRERLSGDRGVWQINYQWDDDLRQAGIINSAQDLFNPLTNARAAMFVYQRQGLDAWAMARSGRTTYQSGGDPFRATNMSAAQAAVGRAASQGLLGQDWQSPANVASGASSVPQALPRDARLVEVPGSGPGTGRFAMFRVMPGLTIRYRITSDSGVNTAGTRFQRMSRQQVGQTFGDVVAGGDAAELADIPTGFGTYQAFTNAILDQLFATGDPRRNDSEVMRVAAEIMARPDMTEAEIENKLKGTRYYQQRTEGQLRWNDLPEAEREVQRRDMLARMEQSYRQHTGRGLSPSQRESVPVEALASGAMSFSDWVETRVKPQAQADPNSPWSRQLREEREEQRQRPIDIENTVQRIRETLTQWGLNWSERTLAQWASGIMNNTRSDDDLMGAIKKQAQVLYPWKDPEMETVVAAAPWVETYNRVLERQGSLQTPEIARVLSGYGRDPDNNDPWSFEQRLKLSDAYDQTRQGADDAYSTVAELAGMMGF